MDLFKTLANGVEKNTVRACSKLCRLLYIRYGSLKGSMPMLEMTI